MLPVYVEILDVIKKQTHSLASLRLFKRNCFYTSQLRNAAARWQQTDRNLSVVTPKSQKIIFFSLFTESNSELLIAVIINY